MSATDNPLKVLILQTKETFASWLLGRPVTAVRELNVEFAARNVRSDLIFVVEDAPRTILHLELQGGSSHRPMPLRELEYISRIVDREIGVPTKTQTRLHSVVLYVGQGAGATDTGQYEVRGLGNNITLRWQYNVIRLWQLTPQWLHSLGEPALLALAGQTKLTDPEEELSQTLAHIREIDDGQLRTQLMGAFVSLLPSEEIVAMMEAYLESDEQWVLQLPYLRLMRERAMKSGREEGIAAGRAEGLAKGRAEGRVDGVRHAILDGVLARFDPPARIYKQLQTLIEDVYDVEKLQAIFNELFSVENMKQYVEAAREQLQEDTDDQKPASTLSIAG